MEKERVGQKRRTKRDKEEEKNLLRVPGDERTERSVHRRIWRGRREMQEVSGSASGVLAKGRVRCLRKKERARQSRIHTHMAVVKNHIRNQSLNSSIVHDVFHLLSFFATIIILLSLC